MSGGRTIILHYHLFKNAGTSVDAILKRNFPGKWVTREFPGNGGNNTPLVEQWIRDTPDAVAYSSHTMLGPIPRIDGMRIISLMLLRDPIERIKSAYRFERTQQADTWGAQLAKQHDFEGYVRARLARPGDRQCRDFQTYRLASLSPGTGTELERAQRALGALTVVGRVETFDDTMARLAAEVEGEQSGDRFRSVQMNTSAGKEDTEMSEALVDLLREANANDFRTITMLEQLNLR